MHVTRSMIIPAPIDKVWAAVRAFDGVAHWSPAVSAARMESGSSTETGHIRHLEIVDGSVFRETLLAHSDLEHFYTYDIVESGLPVSGYVSTHRFIEITHTNQTLGIWEGWFSCAEDQKREMAKVVGDDIYIGGMMGLADFVKTN